MRWTGIILACVSGFLPLAHAETATLEASADTSLWELDPTFNFGGESEIVAGTLSDIGNRARSRILLKFDVASQVPTEASIESAQLRMIVVRTPPAAASSTFALHRVLSQWNEGTSSGELPGGAPARGGDTTWQARIQGMAAWSTPGGALGVDYAAEASGTVTIVGNGAYVLDFNTRGLADLEIMTAASASLRGPTTRPFL